MFLDYDGTLSPIVEDPERAFMSAEVRVSFKNYSTKVYIHIQLFVKLKQMYMTESNLRSSV